MNAVRFSLDGLHLLMAASDPYIDAERIVRLWETEVGEEVTFSPTIFKISYHLFEGLAVSAALLGLIIGT